MLLEIRNMNIFDYLKEKISLKSTAILAVVLTLILTLGSLAPIIFAATNFRGGTYIVSNTQSPAWADPVNANVTDIVQFKVDIINDGSEVATNVRVKADLPSDVSGSSIASTIHVVADNASEVTDTATVNINSAGSTNHSLVYFPGHAILVTNSGQTAIESIGSGGYVAIGDILPGQVNYVEVSFKAQLVAQSAPSPSPSPSPSPTPTPSVTPTPTPSPSPAVGGIVQCPAGTTRTVQEGNVIVCVQQTQNQTQTNNNNQNVTVNQTPTPTSQPQVLGVKTLPKTGLPVEALLGFGSLPIGVLLRKFRKVSGVEKDPAFIWKDRQFKLY